MDKIEVSRLVDIYDATPADKKKSKIAEIADELNVPCWSVAEVLKEAGCDVNLLWFSQQKIKMQKRKSAAPTKEEADAEKAAEKAAAAEGTGANKAYLQKIIKEQDRQLREKKECCEALQEKGRALADTIREKDRELMEKDAEIRELKREAELEKFQYQEQIKVETAQMIATLKNRDEEISRLNAELDGYRAAAEDRAGLLRLIEQREKQIAHYERICEEKDVQVRRLQTKNEELELYTNAVDNENAKLHEQINLLLNGAAALKNAAGEEPEAPRPNFEMLPAKEYPSCQAPGGELELADVLNDFCRSLSGVESYLCGRILEALWCWRYNKAADPLRVLGGLVSELIEMELDEQETQEDVKCVTSGII